MNIGIQCTHCQKRYNAPASMADKRVKCKHCGKVFAIPADSVESFDDQSDSTGGFKAATSANTQQGAAQAPSLTASARQAAGAPAVRAIGAGAGQVKAPPAEGEEPVKLGDPRHGIAKKIKRAEDVSDVDLANDQPARFASVRPSVPFDFPGADILDRFVAPTLLVLGLAWLAYSASGAHPEHIAWPGILKLGLYLGLFFVIGFPAGYMALAWAGRKCRFAMPPMAPLRALAAFAIPFAMAMIMWLVGESLTMLIVGTFFGAVIACAAVWFLFRIQPQEIATTAGATVGGLALSVAVSYGLLLLINLVMAAAARSSGRNELATSPVGPTFAWDVPVGSKTDHPPRQIAKADSGTTPTTNETPAGAATPIPTPPTPNGSNPTPSSTEPTPAGALPAPGTTANPPNPPTPAPPASIGTNTPDILPKPIPATTGSDQPPIASATGNPAATLVKPVPDIPKPPTPAPADPPAPTPAKPIEPASPFVAAVIPIDVGPIETLLFPPAGGQAMAVIHLAGQADQVDLWGLNPPERKGKLTFRRDRGVPNRFVLSATGDLLAQVVTWPRLQASIWSFQAEKVLKSAELKPEIGAPELRSFAANDSLVVQWMNKENVPDMEVFNTREAVPRRITYFPVDPFDSVSGNPSISPDGRTMALATEIDKAGGIDLFDLTAQRKRIQRLKMPLSKWVKPTGLAFSPDGRNVAIFLENQGRGLITIHNTTLAAKPVHEHAYPDSPVPAGAVGDLAPGGRTVLWIDNQTILLYGSELIDAETGQSLGRLEVPHVRTHSLVDKETILMQIRDGSDDRVVLVKLKLDELDKARKAVRAAAKPK